MAKHLPPRGSALPPWRASLLSALMWLILLTILPARLHAQNFEYTYQGNTVMYIGDPDTKFCKVMYSGSVSGALTLPAHPIFVEDEEVTEYSLTEIMEGAFYGCSNLTSVSIPTTVSTIGREAFSSCSNLTSVIIPNSITSIGVLAFSGTHLTEVNLPASVKSLGASAFQGCENLTSINIPEGITEIGQSTFMNCTSLKSVTIPNSVTSLGAHAFARCSNLESITFSNKLRSIGNYAFNQCTALTSITLPETLTTLGESAFADCTSVTALTLPKSLKTITSGAFSAFHSLESLTIPSSVTTIEAYAFSYCENLSSIVIPSSVTTIGEGAFAHNNLNSIIVPLSVTSLAQDAFYSNELTKIAVPSALSSENYGNYTVGYNADCEVTEDGWIYGPGKSSILFVPHSLNGNYTIPETITAIGKNAFALCNGLTSITIPGSISEIGDYAFAECRSLTEITYNATEPIEGSWEIFTNSDIYSTATLNTPFMIESKVKQYEPWNLFEKIVAKEPSADDVVLNEKSIVVATNGWIDLQSLINNKVVEGIPGSNSDYSVILSNTDIAGSQQDGTFYFLQPGTATVTFTNKEFNDISFSIEVTAKYSPSNCITSEYETLYIGDSKTITVPEDYLPLSEFTITKWLYSGYPDADFDFDVNGNSLTLTGVAEGKRGISFRYRFGEVSNVITIANKPSAGDIEVKEKSITIPTNVMIYFHDLINNKIVEGVPGTYSDYSITYSDNTTGVLVDDGPCAFRMSQPGTATITYTHKEFPDVKFSIEVTAKYGPNVYINTYLGNVYVGESKTVTITEDFIPLSEYNLEKGTYSDYPDADFDFTVDGNKITFTGVTEGVAFLTFYNRFGTSSSQITIAPKPSADDIKVNVSKLTYPIDYSFYLSYLISNNVVEGIPGSNSEYSVEASDPDMISLDGNCITFKSPGTTTLTFTNKEFSEISFSIDVTAMSSPAQYISSNFSILGSAYVGESTTIVLPDDYIPFSNYDVEAKTFSDGGKFEFDIKGNTLTVTGISEGTAQLRFYDKVLKPLYFSGQIKIKTREVSVEVTDGKATAVSQSGVPVTVALPKNIVQSVKDDEKMVWESKDEEIASVDPVTGEITPLKLGKTTITVKKMPKNQTYALKSRAGDEETLVTIEFWVTELELWVNELKLAKEMNLTVGDEPKFTCKVNAGDKATYPEDKIEPHWTSSNPEVLAIDETSGKATALKEGSAVITISTSIGTKQTIVNVEPDNTPAGSLSINPSDVTLTVGSRLSLSTKGADGKKVVWRTSDSFVAQIDENGVVTGIASGTAIITATIEGTSTSAKTTVTVFERTTGIEATETSEPVVTVDNMTISVSGIDSDLPVEIYNVSGRLIASRKGSCSVAVGQTGIYIVRTGATARKVAVKH